MINGINEKCCGCAACEKICPNGSIKMQKNAKGFIEPIIDDSCINCGLCEKTCPLMNANKKHYIKKEFYAAKRNDEKLRAKSQSGGAFSVLAENILKKQGTVYGVLLNSEQKAVYARVSNMRKLKALRGSKYVQAELCNVFNDVIDDLINEREVLFSGTPCHVHALIEFIKAKRISANNLITVDLICHGVVSPSIYEQYKRLFEEKHNKKIKSFNFRDKQFGWHGHITSIKSGFSRIVSSDYVNIFYSNLTLRDCCYECKYSSFERVGDISIGDCWGIEKFASEFDDNKGCSLIIINSEKGKRLFNSVSSSFDLLSVSKEQILQPNLIRPTERPSQIDRFWDDYYRYGFEYAVYKYCNINPLKDYELIKKPII